MVAESGGYGYPMLTLSMHIAHLVAAIALELQDAAARLLESSVLGDLSLDQAISKLGMSRGLGYYNLPNDH
ncbi:hypothetical protein E4U30_007528 [Claviceps sp. LM220 group G6]|nr:hypothetical protein E4U15_004488 [Claviceps sp. LM218 group G6]KAG6091110.1 hypothetical protein E4U30_007528 [Claviceps sp. LM220 group G6]